MKRWKTILCAALVLLAVSLAGLAWWQRENLKAVKAAAQHTSEELEEKLAENQQRIQEAVNAAPEITVREVTEEERQALRDGTMTQEELVERLLDIGGQEASQPAAGNTAPASGEAALPASQQESGGLQPAVSQSPVQEPSKPTPAESSKPTENTYQKALSALIARVYVLREEYTLALDNMYASAKAEYKALPAEKRSKTNLAKMASGYLSKASALEKECDGKMDEITSAMEKLIKENNGNMGLVDTVVYTYANEKSLKKSWYLSELERKGLI